MCVTAKSMLVTKAVTSLITRLSAVRTVSSSVGRRVKHDFPEACYDLEYICDIKNKPEIDKNICERKGVGNIDRIHELYTMLQRNEFYSDSEKFLLHREFLEEVRKIPNKTFPLLFEYGDVPKVVKLIGSPRNFTFKPKEFNDITKDLRLMRTEHLGKLTGPRSYIFMGDLAEMEKALVHFSVQHLLEKKFQLISVPDILHSHIIDSCGMNTKGIRTQVYSLDPKMHGPDLCLSGTSEMALAGYVMNRTFTDDQLPLRLAAVSRCYRAETSSLAEERGIYRVHQFTKVEMFAVTTPHTSAAMLEELRSVQEATFEQLGLHVRTLDMPPCELGAPARRKYDVEAWLPGRKVFGELSSSSDCSDYQARRLAITCQASEGSSQFVHTVNGTAVAVPRTLIALLETHQRADGSVIIPEVLRPYMGGKKVLQATRGIPEIRLHRARKGANSAGR